MATTHFYRGWHYVDNGPKYHPVTGRWKAWRYGVEIGANNEALLKRMIDTRCEESRENREAAK